MRRGLCFNIRDFLELTALFGYILPGMDAKPAYFVETEKLGLQYGFRDQLCSAYGGINYILMSCLADASVSPIQIPNSSWWELENRLSLVYIGKPHNSSDWFGLRLW